MAINDNFPCLSIFVSVALQCTSSLLIVGCLVLSQWMWFCLAELNKAESKQQLNYVKIVEGHIHTLSTKIDREINQNCKPF